MKYKLRLMGLASLLLLTACGEDSSGSSVTVPAIPPAAATPVNVSLAANGSSVAATYGGAMASFVNDGDNTTTTNFWSGNIADDAVTIDFGLSRTVTEISVYTSDTSFNSGSPTKYIEISADNSTWKKTAQIVGGDVSCSTFSSGSGKIRCVFSTPQSIRYYRVRVVGAAPASQQIVEMEALGS
jgi:hypothetical protein